MISAELLAEIAQAVRDKSGCSLVADEAAESLLDRVAESIVSDSSHVWWWESLRARPDVYVYDEGDPFPLLVARLEGRRDVLFLVVTDDCPRPWPVIRGSISELLSVLRDCQTCEYFLCNESASWAIFDTHHNVLIFAGDCPRRPACENEPERKTADKQDRGNP